MRNAAAALCLIVSGLCATPPVRAEEGGFERWNAFGQATVVGQKQWAFHAPYTNLNGANNSLLPERARSWSWTVTGYVGLALGRSTALYFAPEAVAQLPLSGLHGLGGAIQNAELQKTSGTSPTYYRSRLYLRHTENLGGTSSALESGPLQLAQSVDSRRLVITAGNLSVVDIFDRNRYVGDGRRQLMNMAFLTYAAYDYAADARGFSWGLAAEYYHDDWVLRVGRFLGPAQPNGLQLDRRFFRRYADQIEVEHAHVWAGQPGRVRVLAYRNHQWMGGFADAIAAQEGDPSLNAANCTGYNYGSTNASAPDLCHVRRVRTKMGLGVSLEQALGDEAGVFAKLMVSDGRSEVVSFNSADRSLALGWSTGGARWQRPADTVGVGYAINWISGAHAQLLRRGGVDNFIGDGALRAGREQVFETFYSAALIRGLWLSLDLQYIRNPAYNADRGPVRVAGLRMHAEF